MNPNILPSSDAVLIGVIDPDAYAANTYTTDWVSMATFQAIQAIVFAGDLGTNATVDAKLQQATSAAGANAKDIAGKSLTQLTKAGTDDNKQAIINCRSEELDVNGGFTHVQLSVTIGTAACDMSACILGHYARYQPATDLTTVDEVVS